MAGVTRAGLSDNSVTSAKILNGTIAAADLAAGVVPRRLAFTTRSTLYQPTTSVASTAADIFASDLSITADGSTAYRFEIYFPNVYAEAIGNSNTAVSFVDGSGTVLGISSIFGRTTTSFVGQYSFYSCFSYTPGAGTQTFNVRGTVSVPTVGNYPQYAASTSILMHFAIYEPFPV